MGGAASLTKGAFVRCPGLGVGCVKRFATRESRRMAVVEFEHQPVAVFIPVKDTPKKFEQPLRADQTETLLDSIGHSGVVLARSWDRREQIGEQVIRCPDPFEWAALLGAYAKIESTGHSVGFIDKEMVCTLKNMLAAEIWASSNEVFSVSSKRVSDTYDSVAADTHVVNAA